MADPVTWALIATAAATTAGTGASYSQAKSQQDYQTAAMDAQRKAAGIQNQQLSDQAALERNKSHNEANIIRSRLRVAAGESGIGFGGTYEALSRQADYDEYINKEIINRNLMNSIKSSNSQLQPGQPVMSPILAAFMGGLGGLQSGLSIGSSIQKTNWSGTPKTTTTSSNDRSLYYGAF